MPTRSPRATRRCASRVPPTPSTSPLADTARVNATLARGGAITGRISGVGHQQTYVFVDSPRENSGHSALVGRDGGFRVTDLTPGVAYRVCAETLDIYNDRQVCRSKQVIAKRGGTVHGIDLQFPAETHLRITVTETAGHRLGGVRSPHCWLAEASGARGSRCSDHVPSRSTA